MPFGTGSSGGGVSNGNAANSGGVEAPPTPTDEQATTPEEQK